MSEQLEEDGPTRSGQGPGGQGPGGQGPGGQAQGEAESTEDGDERVPLTPGLVILGLVALALGLLSAVVMSANTLAR